MSLSELRSRPAATAAKLGAKLVAAGSGLWHGSLRYKLFMLKREGEKKQNREYIVIYCNHVTARLDAVSASCVCRPTSQPYSLYSWSGSSLALPDT